MIKQIYNSLTSSWWKGTLTGLLLIVLLLYGLMGLLFDSGTPVILNILAGLLIGFVILCLMALIFWLLKKLFALLPGVIVIGFLAAMGSLIILKILFPLPDYIYYIGCLTLLVFTAVSFGIISQSIGSGFNSFKGTQRIIIAIFFIVWFGIIGWTTYWLSSKGDFELNYWPATPIASVTPLAIENPATVGKYKVQTTTYGSGKNQRRNEFGKNAKLITKTVDASLLLPEWKGFKKKMREWYWGFGVKEFPLNGLVWYPEGDGPFPLVLVVHGNHGMEEYSDPGYAYLGELLASKGYIMVSVDENFLNATWSGDFTGKEMQTRGWMLLKHLEVWKEWNQNKNSPFYNRVNLDQIALIGHSRGGEAIAIAAAFNTLDYYPDNASVKFDFNFNIRSIIAVAPTDRRYIRRLNLKDVNYLTLQGGYDSDEPSFFGMRQAERITYSKEPYFFKAGIYMPGGNHGQFNSVWKTDASAPFEWFLNRKAMIPEKDQQEVAKVYISGFLQATLDNKTDYIPLFENWQYGKSWLPEGNYLNRFEDNRFIAVASFDEDVDLTTTSIKNATIKGKDLNVWREAELFYRDGKDKQANSAAVVGWLRDSIPGNPSYAISLPSAFVSSNALAERDRLTFALSSGNIKELKSEKEEKKEEEPIEEKERAPDFSIVLVDSLGTEASIPAHELIQILPRWEIQYLKLKDQTSESFGDLWEPTLASYQLPLLLFIKKAPALKIDALKQIEFRFDLTTKGVIIIDKIGFQKR